MLCILTLALSLCHYLQFIQVTFHVFWLDLMHWNRKFQVSRSTQTCPSSDLQLNSCWLFVCCWVFHNACLHWSSKTVSFSDSWEEWDSLPGSMLRMGMSLRNQLGRPTSGVFTPALALSCGSASGFPLLNNLKTCARKKYVMGLKVKNVGASCNNMAIKH